MLKPLILSAALALTTPALAIECPVSHAIYAQRASEWQLHFSDVPRDGAANQIAAFRIVVPNDDTPFDGGIYIPNGFGQPLGDIGRDCPLLGEDDVPDADATEACRFWNGQVYALVDGSITEFPYNFDEPDTVMAPAEILLPGFAANVWYSMLRDTAFTDGSELTDSFQLATCAK